MLTIVNKQILTHDVKRLDIRAESIAPAARPGQFVIVIPRERGKWIPLAVIDTDPAKGTITLIFKEIGSATRELGDMAINDQVFSVTGPFGTPARIERTGTVICAASGLGTAQILPICRAFREAGNKVIGIIGARSRREIMLESQMRLTCSKVLLATSDGLYERKSSVWEAAADLIKKEKIGLVYSIGPVTMMREVSSLALQAGIPARVQVSPLIVCGRGLCGSCRIKQQDRMVLTCQHGPEFDARDLDFDAVLIRLQEVEKSQESQSQPDVMDVAGKFFPGLLRK